MRPMSVLTLTAVFALTGAAAASAEFWQGGNAPNTHHGTVRSDRLYGAGGNDNLWGGRGADSVYGQTESDKLYGGPGADYVDTGMIEDRNKTKDIGYGNGGNDIVRGRGPDKLFGGRGKDKLYMLNPMAATVARCGPGNDTLKANTARFPGRKVGCEHYVDHLSG